ncbi:MAG: UDP-N-acetylglucosamine diphosphorylase [Lachnospiraceae bacterium]|jgi:bifunctional UDP-N-acetylglucosamine pyrophosphorylase/glucosamine-1-phosphate N-acetyltransferase|nr:UDP-N-acetylglucosamine diphosphorylase [Lachnospiraceae bacterium]
MAKIKAVILAAGKGTRMKSELPKVLHEACGKPMVEYSIEAARGAGADDICLVVGHKADLVKETVGDKVSYVLQEEQLGTGHAVKCASDFIGTDGITMVLCGDTPLITGDTLKKLVDTHISEQNTITVLTAVVDDPTGYGRIIKDNWGKFVKIVEQKDATLEEQRVDEINSGMYLFDSAVLNKTLKLLSNDNAQGEYYLTDTIEIVKSNNMGVVATMTVDDVNEIKGVNSKEQLAEAEELLKARK